MASNIILPEANDQVKALSALIKGSIPHCTVADFPTDVYQACKRLVTFLTLWFGASSNKKPEERLAFKDACPKLTGSEVKQIVNSLHEYKVWLKKKNNMTTGVKTDPVLKTLFQVIFKQEEQSLQKAGSASSSTSKPATKRMRGQQSPGPSKEESQPAKASESKPVKAVKFLWDSEPEQSNESEIVSVSSSGIVHASELPEVEEFEKEKEILKKPAKAGASKKPAAKTVLKRPAASKAKVKKKPAKAEEKLEQGEEEAGAEPEKAEEEQKDKADKKPAKARGKAWLPSKSFGLVHETRAAKKAYIQAKPDMAGKKYCLVNVELPKGKQQDEIMDQLIEKACEEGWTKESLVKCKLGLLKA